MDPESRDRFERWYRQEYRAVLSLTMLVCKDTSHAEDATTDAFLKALERWNQVEEMTSPGGWVSRVAVNNAKRRLTTNRLRRSLKLTSETTAIAPAHKPSDDGLWNAVRELPQRQRCAIVLRYLDDLTQREVASELGVAEGTAAATLSQARNSLKSSIQGNNDDD